MYSEERIAKIRYDLAEKWIDKNIIGKDGEKLVQTGFAPDGTKMIANKSGKQTNQEIKDRLPELRKYVDDNIPADAVMSQMSVQELMTQLVTAIKEDKPRRGPGRPKKVDADG